MGGVSARQLARDDGPAGGRHLNRPFSASPRLSTNPPSPSTGGAGAAGLHRRACGRRGAMTMSDHQLAQRERRARLLAAAPDWRASDARVDPRVAIGSRSEEHTSELQSLMRISYAVFCLETKYNNSITSRFIIYLYNIPHTT